MSDENKLTLAQARACLNQPEVREEDDTGLAWQEIAASAYRAYSACTGNKNYRGEPMPAFEDLPVPIQAAWGAAVRQVGLCCEYGEQAYETEASWKGWLPPIPCPVCGKALRVIAGRFVFCEDCDRVSGVGAEAR